VNLSPRDGSPPSLSTSPSFNYSKNPKFGQVQRGPSIDNFRGIFRPKSREKTDKFMPATRNNTIKEGYLMKKNSRHRWRRRWIMLGDALYFFNDAKVKYNLTALFDSFKGF
jgi:hypothetical protein